MDIIQLCDFINIQPEIKTKVIQFSNDFDFSIVDNYLKDFFVYEKMNNARVDLCSILKEDPQHIKILSCMLQASIYAYDIYQKKGISKDIYIATMKCYTRFIQETYNMTGQLDFDRYWWTPRQAGCHLFRLGELEYEIKHINKEMVIAIHIPSDASFSPSHVDASIKIAIQFFTKYYPELSSCEYRCHSWLLDPMLKVMLSEKSNILSFQNRFEIYDIGEVSTEFIEWLFNMKTKDYQSLPENTTLQRKVKKHILNGGVIHNSYGKLRI